MESKKTQKLKFMDHFWYGALVTRTLNNRLIQKFKFSFIIVISQDGKSEFKEKIVSKFT
jgi:hypothetical protein